MKESRKHEAAEALETPEQRRQRRREDMESSMLGSTCRPPDRGTIPATQEARDYRADRERREREFRRWRDQESDR